MESTTLPVTDPTLFSSAERLVLSGPDAAAFAYAQFCNDSRLLEPGLWQYGGWLEVKGRVQRFFQLLCLAPDRYVLILRGGDAASMAEGLRRYVFRSKVKIEPIGAEFAAPALPASDAPAHAFSIDESVVDTTVDDRLALAEIRAGVPRIPAALSSELLSAWLDFERLGAISFKKGCYPGQEIAARMYFRGGNSRRLHRLQIATAHTPIGAVLRGAEGQEAGRVLQAVATESGSFEALAVLRDGISHSGLRRDDGIDAGIEVLSAQWAAAR